MQMLSFLCYFPFLHPNIPLSFLFSGIIWRHCSYVYNFRFCVHMWFVQIKPILGAGDYITVCIPYELSTMSCGTYRLARASSSIDWPALLDTVSNGVHSFPQKFFRTGFIWITLILLITNVVLLFSWRSSYNYTTLCYSKELQFCQQIYHFHSRL
jgi:hypothetical protein